MLLYQTLCTQKRILSFLLLMILTVVAHPLRCDEAQTAPFTGIYVTIPEILVNLHGNEKRNHFLKLSITLEAKSTEDARYMNDAMPHLIDQFQIYLRELRIDDLMGAEGLLLLKQQLVERSNAVLSPVKVVSVLFREILVQ